MRQEYLKSFNCMQIICIMYTNMHKCVHTHTHTYTQKHIDSYRGCYRGFMVKALDCGIVAREFVFQSRYYVHFQANTLGKGMNPLTLLAMG